MTRNKERVFLTGSTGSVGLELTRLLVAEGFPVTAQIRDESRVPALRAAVGTMPLEDLCFVSFDFQEDPQEWPLPTDIDILINCAGIGSRGVRFPEVSWTDYHEVLQVNLHAPLFLISHYLPGMLEKGWGRIVNVNSIWGLRGTEESGPYVVSKHGLAGATRAIAKEVAGTGVTINDVCPGAIDSALMDRVVREEAERRGESVASVEGAWRSSMPGGRFVTTEEVADAVLFLVRKGSSGINGQSVVVDLGRIS